MKQIDHYGLGEFENFSVIITWVIIFLQQLFTLFRDSIYDWPIWNENTFSEQGELLSTFCLFHNLGRKT
jgi:hypothetical protein